LINCALSLASSFPVPALLSHPTLPCAIAMASVLPLRSAKCFAPPFAFVRPASLALAIFMQGYHGGAWVRREFSQEVRYVLLVVPSVGLSVSVCQGAALPGGVGTAAPAAGCLSVAAACSQNGREEMMRVRNKFTVEVCGAVRAVGRCPSLCKREGGCFTTDYPGPGVVLSIAEIKRRCHRSHRVASKLYILNRGGEL
jgi:hypothetical protein